MERLLTIPSNRSDLRRIYTINRSLQKHSLLSNKKKTEIYDQIEMEKYQKKFLKSLLSKNKSDKILGFDQYNSVLTKSFGQYKSKGLTEEELSELNIMRKKPKNTGNLGKSIVNYQQTYNDDEDLHGNKLKVKVKDFEYKNPLNSLNIINDNYSIFNEINRDVLLRQRNLFDKSVEALEGNLKNLK